MSAVPLQISKSTFVIGQLNSMILRGRRLDQLDLVALEAPIATNIIWVNLSEQDAPMNSHYTLISGTPLPVSGDITPGMKIYGEVTVNLKSFDDDVRSLRVPAIYYTNGTVQAHGGLNEDQAQDLDGGGN